MCTSVTVTMDCVKGQEPQLERKVKKVRCNLSLCSYETHKMQNLAIHYDNHQSRGRQYPCDECDHIAFSHISKLKNHVRVKHRGIRTFCDFPGCNFSASSQRGVTRHKQGQHEIIDLSCKFCEFTTSRKDYLSNHIKIEHEGLRFNCDQCGRKFKQKAARDIHIKTSHEGFRFKCSVCDYPTTQLGVLRQHERRKHRLGREEHRCENCPYSVATLKLLETHKQTCTAKRKEETEKNRRMRLKKPVVCDLCGQWMDSSNLGRHKRRLHNNFVNKELSVKKEQKVAKNVILRRSQSGY